MSPSTQRRRNGADGPVSFSRMARTRYDDLHDATGESNIIKGLIMKKWLSNRWHLGYVVEREAKQRDDFTYDCEGEIVSFEYVHNTKDKAIAHAKHTLNKNIVALEKEIADCRCMLSTLDSQPYGGWFRVELAKPKRFWLF